MSGYTPYYSGGWQSGESGETPITPAALNNMETGIGAAVTAADVVDNLTSTATNKPLSANMGKALSDSFTNMQTIVPSRSGDSIYGGYIKVGKIVIVSILITFASDVPVNTVVFSLPNSQVNTIGLLTGFKDASGQRGNIVILRNLTGNVTTNTELSAGNYSFVGSYISND